MFFKSTANAPLHSTTSRRFSLQCYTIASISSALQKFHVVLRPDFLLSPLRWNSFPILRPPHNVSSGIPEGVEAPNEFLERSVHNQSLRDLLRLYSNRLFRIQFAFRCGCELYSKYCYAIAEIYFRCKQFIKGSIEQCLTESPKLQSLHSVSRCPLCRHANNYNEYVLRISYHLPL